MSDSIMTDQLVLVRDGERRVLMVITYNSRLGDPRLPYSVRAGANSFFLRPGDHLYCEGLPAHAGDVC